MGLNYKLDINKLVFITGGAGYIGTHVIDNLLKNGFKVRLYDRLLFGKKPIEDFRRNKNFQLVVGDINDTSKLLQAMDDCQAVVHLAGLVGDPASSLDTDMTRQINIFSTRSVKEISKLKDIQRFIFASSCSVYGTTNRLVNENSNLNPVSLYATSKIDCEQELLQDHSTNFHPVILRFATVFGHSRRPRFDLVANLFVAQAYNDGLITVTGSEQWRPFIHPKDIANAIFLALSAKQDKIDRQIFNVGDERLNITIGDLARLVGKIVKKDKHGKSVQISIKDDASDKRNYRVDFRKIEKVLNFHAKTSFEQGLEEIYDNFVNKSYKEYYKDPIYINFEMTKRLLQGVT